MIKHEAFSREGFALGALTAAKFIIDKVGFYNMNDIVH
jgi:4-hydroxy-tetrahydrodipicolinate reductase